MRKDGRKDNELRQLQFEIDFNKNAAGSCLVRLGNTVVLCNASIEEKVPKFLKNTGQGWVTAEYGMLPAATDERIQREITTGKIGGRTQEIQRMIGRVLRQAVDLRLIGERQIIIDCDVLQADGSTRCASICGGYIALSLAIKRKLLTNKKISRNPIKAAIAAVSCGIIAGKILIDLNYSEDAIADVDANIVFNNLGGASLIEVQSSAERTHFTKEQMAYMLDAASDKAQSIMEMQKNLLGLADS